MKLTICYLFQPFLQIRKINRRVTNEELEIMQGVGMLPLTEPLNLMHTLKGGGKRNIENPSEQ
jgi:hypothetical protein